jgi:RimJ/RimL family protein N-acetyltransferase
MSAPFLIGPRVQLRPPEPEDAPLFTTWINDPEIRQYLTLRFPKSLRAEKDWIESTLIRGTPQEIVFTIELRRGKRPIGTVGMHGIDWVHRRAITGIFLMPVSQRGHGYGTEAKNLLIEYAFRELGLHSLSAFAFADNQASIRALKSQGYQQTGVYREAFLVRGKWTDAVCFDLLRAEWEKLSKSNPKRAPGQSRKRAGKL